MISDAISLMPFPNSLKMQIIGEGEDIDQNVQHINAANWSNFLNGFRLSCSPSSLQFFTFRYISFSTSPQRNERNIGQLLWEQFDT